MKTFSHIGQERDGSQGWIVPAQGQSWAGIKVLWDLISLSLELLEGLGFSLPMWKQECWLDYLSGLSDPNFLWLGNSRCPILQYQVEAMITVSAHCKIGNHTTWEENQVKGMWCIQLWKLGENSVWAEAIRCFLFSSESSTVHQAPSECCLKKWMDGSE